MRILIAILIICNFCTLNKTMAQDVLALLDFTTPLKGHIDHKQQKLKLLNEIKGQYYYTGRLKHLKGKLQGVECTFKNKYLPNAESQTLTIDFNSTKTFHKIYRFKYSDTETMEASYKKTIGVLEANFRNSEKLDKQPHMEIDENDEEIIKEGFRYWQSTSSENRVFVEFCKDPDTNELILKFIDYRYAR
jgi:hypothetical protein